MKVTKLTDLIFSIKYLQGEQGEPPNKQTGQLHIYFNLTKQICFQILPGGGGTQQSKLAAQTLTSSRIDTVYTSGIQAIYWPKRS